MPSCLQGQTFVGVVKKEGAGSLYLGLSPALTRSVLYGGLRLGLYEPCKHLCELAFESTNIFMKIASGAVSGAFATLLTNPVEVLKVQTPFAGQPDPTHDPSTLSNPCVLNRCDCK